MVLYKQTLNKKKRSAVCNERRCIEYFLVHLSVFRELNISIKNKEVTSNAKFCNYRKM